MKKLSQKIKAPKTSNKGGARQIILNLLAIIILLLSATTPVLTWTTQVSAAKSATSGKLPNSNINWSIDGGVLTLSGYGDLPSNTSNDPNFWP